MLGKLLGWLSAHAGELVGAELEFTTPVGERAVIKGRVDRLERDSAGRLVVVDLKTGRSAPRDGDVQRHPQLGVYQLAASLGAFAEVAGADASVGGAKLVQLGSAKTARVQVQPPLDSDPDPDWALRLVGAVADGMSGTAFRAKPGSACRICPGRMSCPAVDDGRQVPSD